MLPRTEEPGGLQSTGGKQRDTVEQLRARVHTQHTHTHTHRELVTVVSPPSRTMPNPVQVHNIS